MVGPLTLAKPGTDGMTSVEWPGDAPFFVSSRMPITVMLAAGVKNVAESEQGDNRIEYLHFREVVPPQVRNLKL